MDERMLKAMVAAGAIKNINIIASGARFHIEAKTPNGPITAETRKGRFSLLFLAGARWPLATQWKRLFFSVKGEVASDIINVSRHALPRILDLPIDLARKQHPEKTKHNNYGSGKKSDAGQNAANQHEQAPFPGCSRLQVFLNRIAGFVLISVNMVCRRVVVTHRIAPVRSFAYCYNLRPFRPVKYPFMTKKFFSIALAAVLMSGCILPADTRTEVSAPDANEIARANIIVDTHIDVPYRLVDTPADISQATDGGDFDYPRAVSGGLNAPFMSIYTPAKLEAEGGSKQVADELIDMVEGFAEQWPDKFATARSPADVREQFAAGIMSMPLGLENGSPIEGDLANLQYFFDRGIRYITLTHSLSNHISDSSYDENRQWNGLSEFGTDVVREMNQLGIMVDVSHVSDDAFWQVMEISKVAVIASHSSARHFTPGFERNMSDEMIVALAKNGGVIQINFGSSFVSEEARIYADARKEARELYAAEHPDFSESDLWEKYPAIYAEEHGPLPFANLDIVLDHFDHVVALTSVDHVGIGSDYDGVGDSLPIGLKDVSTYPNLVQGLLDRGYSEDDITKILGENLLRVWQAVEDYAATTSSKT